MLSISKLKVIHYTCLSLYIPKKSEFIPIIFACEDAFLCIDNHARFIGNKHEKPDPLKMTYIHFLTLLPLIRFVSQNACRDLGPV